MTPEPIRDRAERQLLDALRRKGHEITPAGDGHTTKCPYCHGRLTFSSDRNGALIIDCTGLICAPQEVLYAAGKPRLPLTAIGHATPVATTVVPAVPKEWIDLRPLDRWDVPAFPTHTLAALREWVEAEAHATQTPPDLAAWNALAVVSFAISGRITVDVGGRFDEPTNIFVVVALPPAARKSAVFRDATAPLREAERELIEASRVEIAKKRSERRQLVKRLEHLEKKAGSAPAVEAARAAQEAAEVAARLADFPEPRLPRMIVENATTEILEVLLEKHDGKIASLSPEGKVFDNMAGRYSAGAPDYDVYLKGHAGDELRVDRMSRDEIYVARPTLTCAYSVQPSVIKRLGLIPGARGSGLLSRFIYSLPESLIGRRAIATPTVPPRVTAEYGALISRLIRSSDRGRLRFTADAYEVLLRWEAEIEQMLAEGGEMEAITDWGGKLYGATIRLAAIIHAVKHASAGPLTACIDTETVNAAITIARYTIPHADHALTTMSASEAKSEEDARYILRWIKVKGLRAFTLRDAHQHGKRRFKKVAALDHAIEELCQRGYIRLVPAAPGRPGRPASPTYQVNPAVFNARPGGQTLHKVGPTPPHPTFGNIEDTLGTNREANGTTGETPKREEFTL